MKHPRVLIIGGGFDYVNLFHNLGFKGTRSLFEADLVVFTGGADVDPELYREPKIPGTHFNRARDDAEEEFFHLCCEFNIPMLGICRGSQFLTVMNGGSLWQDVNNHANGPHDMTIAETGQVIKVTSTHHQMMYPYAVNEKGVEEKIGDILAYAKLSTIRKAGTWVDDNDHSKGHRIHLDEGIQWDPEVVWYSKSDSLCFQPHPEFMNASPELRTYLMYCLMEHIGKSRNWFVDDEKKEDKTPEQKLEEDLDKQADEWLGRQKKDDGRTPLARANWAMQAWGIKNGLSIMKDDHTGRLVYLSKTTSNPVGYADVTNDNENEDPLSIIVEDDACPW